MHALSAVSTPTPAPSDPGKISRATHAAREFEAVLLNTLLGALEHSFASLPGKDSDPASDNYQSLGMQTLATSLASRGGIGIAGLIVHSLLRPSGQGPNGPTGTTKVPPRAADRPVSQRLGP